MNATRDTQFWRRILRKQFQAVGIPVRYIPRITKRKDWYRRCTWTVEQETKFKRWLVKEIRKYYPWNKRMCEREASWWLLDFGWKTRE
jgi:hypothetical protein